MPFQKVHRLFFGARYLDDAVGQLLLGDFVDYVGVVAVLQVDRRHGSDLKALGQIWLLVWVNNLIGDFSRGVVVAIEQLLELGVGTGFDKGMDLQGFV